MGGLMPIAILILPRTLDLQKGRLNYAPAKAGGFVGR
jgi:hypothetical protein